MPNQIQFTWSKMLQWEIADWLQNRTADSMQPCDLGRQQYRWASFSFSYKIQGTGQLISEVPSCSIFCHCSQDGTKSAEGALFLHLINFDYHLNTFQKLRTLLKLKSDSASLRFYLISDLILNLRKDYKLFLDFND